MWWVAPRFTHLTACPFPCREGGLGLGDRAIHELPLQMPPRYTPGIDSVAYFIYNKVYKIDIQRCHMPTATVRVTAETRAILKEMARESKQPMQRLIARAVEQLRRQMVLEHANDRYAALRARGGKWEEELEERRTWETTLDDDLESNE